MKILIAWNYQDVLQEAVKLNIQMTEKQAIDLLNHWRNRIEKAMIAAGEEVIREAIEDFMIEWEDQQLTRPTRTKISPPRKEKRKLEEPEVSA